MLRDRLRDEDGLGLVEVMVVIVMMSIVMSIAASSVVHAMRVQRRQVAEVNAVGHARIAMERMTREIRAANPLLSASADGTEISVQVTRGDAGPVRKITTYRLVGDRIEVSGSVVDLTTGTSTSMATTTLIRGLDVPAGTPVFTYALADGSAPTPTTNHQFYRTVTIRLPLALPERTSPLVVSDTVTIRNAAVPS